MTAQLSFRDYLAAAGIVQTNIDRLDKALGSLHFVVSQMDTQQLKAFKQMDLGRFTTAAIGVYADMNEGLRKDF